MAALISSVMYTKDKVPFFVDRCEEMGIEVLPPDVNVSDHELRRRRRQHPLRPRRGQGRRLRGGRGDQGARASRTGRSSRSGTSASASTRAPSTSGRSRPGQVRRLRLDRRDAQGHARRCSSRRSRPGQKAQEDAQIGQGSIFDLGGDPAADGARRRRSRRRAPADPARGVRPARAARGREGDARHCSSPRTRSSEVRDALRAARRLLARRARRRRRDGDWVTVGGIVTRGQEDPHRRPATR